MKKSELRDICHPAADPHLWLLDPHLHFLNHGSFGACPRMVLDFQRELRERMERQPCEFFVRDLEPLLDEARSAVAKFVGADRDNLVFVPNATAGVNTVLRSLTFKRSDQLLVTDHEYNACRNALDYVTRRSGARVVVVEIPFPGVTPAGVIEKILAAVTPRTRLLLVDHVTSQTGLVLPMQEIIRRVARDGIDTLVDGAHAPGMLPLNLRQLGAAYYTGTCHKWICAPKGAGFLHVRPDRQGPIRPLSISHGANSERLDRSVFQIEFGWTGTWDPSAMLSVPKAIEYMATLHPDGWRGIIARNRKLALAARAVICDALRLPLPCPDEMIGALAAVPLPDATAKHPSNSPLYADLHQDQLRLKYQIEVPVIPWPTAPKRLLRISAQLYNSLPQYKHLAQALRQILPPSSTPK